MKLTSIVFCLALLGGALTGVRAEVLPTVVVI